MISAAIFSRVVIICAAPHAMASLGPVDGFDQEEDTSESDESVIVASNFWMMPADRLQPASA